MTEKYKIDCGKDALCKIGIFYAGEGFLIKPLYEAYSYGSGVCFVGASVFYYGALANQFYHHEGKYICNEEAVDFMAQVAARIFNTRLEKVNDTNG